MKENTLKKCMYVKFGKKGNYDGGIEAEGNQTVNV